LPRNPSTGVYEAPTNSVNPAVANQVISSTDFNAMLTDVETALSTTPATTRALWAQLAQVQDGGALWGGTAGGTADALTVSLTPAITAYATGMMIRFVAPAANTGSAPTLAVNGLSAVTITRQDGSTALAADLAAGSVNNVVYDGTNFRLIGITAGQVATSGSGGAGATITTATTLTAASERIRPVAMTTDAQSITLPNATSLNEGGPIYVFPNTGSRVALVRGNTGTLIATVQPGATVSLYLRDNSTAAGLWSVEGEGALLPAQIGGITLSSTYTGFTQTVVRLTDTLCLAFTQNPSGHPFVLAIDHSTAPATAGVPALIVATNGQVEHAFRISNTKAMIVTNGASSNIYNVTVSGTTCTVSAAATAAVFDQATFTGSPLIAQNGANNDQFVAIDISGAAIRAQAVDCSGTNPSAGSSVNIVAVNGVQPVAIYRETNTTTFALFLDGTGAPYDLKGVVLSQSGTTVTVNTPQSAGAVCGTATIIPNCRMADASYLCAYPASTASVRAVAFSVSGTSVTAGATVLVETVTVTVNNVVYSYSGGTRFQPNLYPATSGTAIFTYPTDSNGIQHVVLSLAGTVVTVGAPLRSVWSGTAGGNFPQAADGFLAMSTDANENSLVSVTLSGTTLSVTGQLSDASIPIQDNGGLRFGLSGGIRGVRQATVGSSRFLAWSLFRFRAEGPPVYVGSATPTDMISNTGNVPVEVAPNKVIFGRASLTDVAANQTGVRFIIWEFPA
jgi:hypothetical protein